MPSLASSSSSRLLQPNDNRDTSSIGGQKLSIVELQAFPKLLATGEDDHFKGHHSYEIAQALGHHSDRMNAIEEEFARLQETEKTYKGHSTNDVAKAFQQYAKSHKGQLPQNFVSPAAGGAASAALIGGSTLALSTSDPASITTYAAAASASATTTMAVDAYSWATLLRSMGWAKILFTIVWIISGVTLLFFGYASFFWLHKLSLGGARKGQYGVASGLAQALPGIKNSKKRRRQTRPLLSGGLGGLLVGFLLFSYLTAVIHNSIVVNEGRKALDAGAYFAVWLIPGLLGAALGGHFAVVAKAMTGILGGSCLTIILTAVFGIKTLVIRIILISIFVALLTAPLLQNRAKAVQMLVLNACTSLIGMVTFLNGVALVAPSPDASLSNWLDLWTLLFMHDSAKGRDAITTGWQTSVFKGYIAASILGAVVGFVFELFLHRRCGHDPDDEWNQYLGTFTQHMESGANSSSPAPASAAVAYDDPKAAILGSGARMTLLEQSARAGLFEPAPSAWQRMVDFFDSEKARPAHYGNLSGDGTAGIGLSGVNLRSSSLRKKMQRKRSKNDGRASATLRNGPARFSALRKEDMDDDDEFDDASSDDDEKNRLSEDDDDATDVERDDADGRKDKNGDDAAARDVVPSLSKDAALSNYGGYALPVPPAVRPSLTTSSSSGSGQSAQSSSSASWQTQHGDSRLTGTTANEVSTSSSSAGAVHVHKPADRYKDAQLSPSTSSSRPAQAPVPATPSLINAISRIQLAQEQARAWQSQHDAQGASPYGTSSSPASPSATNDRETKSGRRK